ncbi:response regulator [Pseudobacteriovorax antillogorgiicola]|uniref:Response regulator receiver domain-containing protein n=1 Tax=Pseudobacteriovorax antillogorgiicola TaxID=1513793 RepID=A0A1Y6BCU7_9BACT|nr:response regulator [Pseudobacteriovorax antillogorgiicola]TCS56488.1 response regulator receiver domain-containing protein [Pseudobacteriovorax antillogorgiicola]SMF04870.1 Response regulator receiver domain-containing protein [Pseudobacteriovorax antillogorgiicola]
MSSTVLVLDDEHLIRRIVSEELEDAGFHVISAGSGQEALNLMANHEIDIVVSDVKMPNMSGIELLDRIQETMDNPPPVILVTAFSENTVQEALVKGAQAVFPKPIDYEALIETVKSKLTPIASRWGVENKIDSPVLSLAENFSSAESAQGRLRLGTGGFFLADPKEMPRPGDVVAFTFTFDELKPLNGQAQVLWTRKQSEGDLPPGFGAELTFLEDPDIDKIIDDYKALNSKSYVPNA